MKALELKNELLNVVGDLLGTYTRPDGSQRPAIWIGNKLPPSDYGISGVECVANFPKERITYGFSRTVHKRQTWQVCFIQHNENEELQEIRDLMTKYFIVTGERTIMPTPQGVLQELQLDIFDTKRQRILT